MQKLLTLTLLCFTGMHILTAQSSPLDKSITMEPGTYTIEQVLKDISAASDFSFSYSPDQVPLDQRVRIADTEQTVAQVLTSIFKDTNIDYRARGNVVILKKKPGPKANRITLSGKVTDQNSGEPLIGAYVKVADRPYGAVTNPYGFYSLTIPAGDYGLWYSYLGYQSATYRLSLKKDTRLNVELADSLMTLEDVTVTSDPQKNILNPQLGVNNLESQTFSNIAYLFGEVDIISGIRLLPGVSTVGEGASGFNVRGGGIDQNLILLDEAPVYNSAHYFGLFSIFNPDVVKDVKLYKSSLPANYGGAVASVFDVRQKEGNNKKFRLKGGVGIPAVRLTAEGPLIKDRSSFLVGFRSTFVDLSSFTFNDGTLENSEAGFEDFNAKVNYSLNEKNTLYLSAYLGRDEIAMDDGENLQWGNSSATLRWNRILNQRLFANFTGVFSRYDFRVKQLAGGSPLEIAAKISDYHLKADYYYYLSPRHQLDFGGSIVWHDFEPGRYTWNNRTTELDQEQALEASLYVSDEFTLNPKTTLQLGLRYSAFFNVGPGEVFLYQSQLPITTNTIIDTVQYHNLELIKQYHNLEPRISLVHTLNATSSLKFTYNRSAQYTHLMSNTTTSMLTDLWKLSDSYLKPQIGNQIALGYFRNFDQNKIESSVELFYRRVNNVVDFKDGADLALNPAIETELLQGEGRAYGMELFVRKKAGRLTGWVGYTLSRSERRIKGRFPQETINSGSYYPSNYDRTHDFKWINSYQISKRWNLSANFVFSTGRPVTLPDGRYEFEGTIVPDFSSRNQQRVSNYHRLDLSAQLLGKNKKKKRWQGSLTFAIYNVYFHKNVFDYKFEQVPGDPYETRIVESSLIGNAIPSITYNFEF